MKVPKLLYVLLIIICILLAANLWMTRHQIQASYPIVTVLNRWTGQVYTAVGTPDDTNYFEPIKWEKPPKLELNFTPIDSLKEK